MSKEALAKVVQRAISDAAFRRQLNSDPSGALRGFDLSADEASALRTGDAGRLSSLGVDQRMSKSYAIGGMASTRLSASDLTPGGGPALVDDLSGAAGRTVTPADPTRPGAVDVDGGTSGTSSVHVRDDPNGFLAANADATGGSAAAPDAFIDQSETYLTRGFDTSQAATPDADATWSGDDIAGPASVADAGGAENPHVSTDDGQLTP